MLFALFVGLGLIIVYMHLLSLGIWDEPSGQTFCCAHVV